MARLDFKTMTISRNEMSQTSTGTKTIRYSVLLMLLHTGGCVTWEPARGVPRDLITIERPSSIRVTDVDGTRKTLKNPIIINDSIVSAPAPPPGTIVMPPRQGLLLRDVNTFELPRVNTGRTIALIGAIIGTSITWASVQGKGSGVEPNTDEILKDGSIRLRSDITLSELFSIFW